MGSVKGQELFKEFLDYYIDKLFILSDGSFDLTTNVQIITSICVQYGLKRNNKLQSIKGFTLYPNHIFCPSKNLFGKHIITDATYSIHYYNGSWVSEKHKKRKQKFVWRLLFRPLLRAARWLIAKILGNKRSIEIEQKLRNLIG
jgi:hypothetical protein